MKVSSRGMPSLRRQYKGSSLLRLSRSGPAEAFDEVNDVPCRGLPGTSCDGPSRALSQPASQGRLAQALRDARCELLGAAGREEQPGLTVTDQVPVAADVRSYAATPCRHRLEKGEWLSLEEARQHEDAGLAVEGELGGESETGNDAEAGMQLLRPGLQNLRSLQTRPRQNKAWSESFSPEQLGSRDQRPNAFADHPGACEEDVLEIGRLWRLGLHRVHAVLEEMDVRRAAPVMVQGIGEIVAVEHQEGPSPAQGEVRLLQTPDREQQSRSGTDSNPVHGCLAQRRLPAPPLQTVTEDDGGPVCQDKGQARRLVSQDDRRLAPQPSEGSVRGPGEKSGVDRPARLCGADVDEVVAASLQLPAPVPGHPAHPRFLIDLDLRHVDDGAGRFSRHGDSPRGPPRRTWRWRPS